MSSAETEDFASRPMETQAAPNLLARLMTLPALVFLAFSDLVLRGFGFKRLHRLVSKWPTLGRRKRVDKARAHSDATDRAAALYFKHPWCLQRSSAAVLLLRCLGYPAQLVIGVRRVPFYTHAWVELGNEIINERPQVVEQFQVLERC